MATFSFDSHRAIFHGLAGTEMTPLRMMPASHSGYELTAISKILDSHTQKCALTSKSSAAPSESELCFHFILQLFKRRPGVGCSVWLGCALI